MTSPWVVIGSFSSPHGVKGYIKVKSEMSSPEAVADYLPWHMEVDGEWHPVAVDDVQLIGGQPVVHIEGFDDRDEVRVFTRRVIAVPRSRLPKLPADEYYWADLLGIEVRDTTGLALGILDAWMETGSNDVLVVVQEKKRHLIPFIKQEVVKAVDLKARVMVVDWDINY